MNALPTDMILSGKVEAAFVSPPSSVMSHRLLWAMLFVSLAVHAGLAAAFLIVPSRAPVGTDESAHVISISLVAAPARPKAEATPPQATLREPEKPVVRKKTPPPLAEKKKSVVAVREPASAEAVVEAAPPAPRLAPATASASGDAAISSIALETRAQGRAAYGRLVWKKIAEAKPAGLHRKSVVDVRFVITAQGELRSVEILHSTGNSELEALARQTLARAAPFPPPPAELGPGDLSFEIPFNFQ